MPRVANIYRCSRCNKLMPNTERVPVTIELRGSLKLKYKIDLCTECAEKDIEGKDTRKLPASRARNRST